MPGFGVPTWLMLMASPARMSLLRRDGGLPYRIRTLHYVCRRISVFTFTTLPTTGQVYVVVVREAVRGTNISTILVAGSESALVSVGHELVRLSNQVFDDKLHY